MPSASRHTYTHQNAVRATRWAHIDGRNPVEKHSLDENKILKNDENHQQHRQQQRKKKNRLQNVYVNSSHICVS